MGIRRGIVFLAVAVTAACSDGSTLEIRPRGSLVDSLQLAGLRMVVAGRELTAEDFGPDGSGLTEVKISVPNSGRLEIGVQLLQSGVVAAEGSFGWEMEPGWEWGMDIFRSPDDPTLTCFGCSGSARIPFESWAATAPDESLWFSWGGKPKGSDIVF